MTKKKRVLALGFASAAALVLIPLTSADAHHPEVTATAICADSTTALVDIHAESWATDLTPDHRVNLDIEIDIKATDNIDAPWVKVKDGQFTPENNYQFDTLLPEPLGLSIDVRAIAIA